MKRGRKKKLAISLMDYMGKRRDMKRQLKKDTDFSVSATHALLRVNRRMNSKGQYEQFQLQNYTRLQTIGRASRRAYHSARRNTNARFHARWHAGNG